ncbi:hypothetical protein JG688_00008497 [Phytophthora aleatoria]|uniref:Crinkler (CRN) family protein n=1 Tax=Phytophthora aleatoria TaxID=2496075 RepID=A0A8J5MG61_9STRA|nr:hypothetical protein JG688_00008497 [Phytophthora aleatoria]
MAKSAATDRTKNPIPVCSGMSGLGKTRMLEEGGTILREMMKLEPKNVSCLIVPYVNGFSFQPVEQSMPIEASFSWRLLYRFFLDMNCSHSFQSWFEPRLPRNGGRLWFSRAVEVIERKLPGKMLEQPATLYLFLGIDEYQQIEKVRAPRKDPETSLLHELVEVVGAFLSSQCSSMVLLPMFAGTDLGVIESSSIANSSYYVTYRLPMTLLTMDQVFSIVESINRYAGLLKYPQIRCDLLGLSGVPRWVVTYLTEVKRACDGSEDVSLKCISGCFGATWTMYVDRYLKSLDLPKLVRLAAFAVSGQKVQDIDRFDEDLGWARLRDSSLCLLIPHAFGACDVRVPYALLQSIGMAVNAMTTAAEKCFASALHDLDDIVDSKMFDLPP